ncbi:MAG: Ca-activated chloride channel family protein [Verrucomicrobiales bacterium]
MVGTLDLTRAHSCNLPTVGIHFAFFIWMVTAQAQVIEDRNGLQATSPQALFVFDASQSMYGNIAGTRGDKLDLAKSIMRRALTEWPQAIELGVLVYGHCGRRAPGGNRCLDIELIVPLAFPDLTEIQTKIAAISARGTTPICAALEAAGKHLEGSTKAGTLVVISDGTEECGGDLMETVRTLVATSVDLKVHILSLDQSEEHNVPLKEMAQLTSGKFFDILQADQAEPAIQSILSTITDSANLTVSALDTWDAETPTAAPITWRLYDGEPMDDAAEMLSLRASKLILQKSGLEFTGSRRNERTMAAVFRFTCH